MHDSPLLIVHIAGGMIACRSGYVALLNRKGSHAHRGIFAAYLVSSAWLTARRKDREVGKADFAIAFFIFATIITLFAVSDVRNIVNGGFAGAPRIFTPEFRATHLPWVPVIVVVVLTIYWLIRVKRGAARPKSNAVLVSAS